MANSLRLVILCSGLILAATPALAQLSAGGGGAKPQAGADAPKANTPEPPPPAIPGAESSPEMVAPPSKVASEMNPNDALFDGISRGDLAAARDALNRGADLNAHNVLGQTPLDSSIDLNRSDITFLLLSMRPSINTPGGSENGEAAAEPQQAMSGRATRTAQAKAAARARKIPIRRASVTAPARLAADGGTANPAIGFLGFGR